MDVARRIRRSKEASAELSVRTFSRPYAPFHDRYQRYYREGLRRYCRAVGGELEIVHLSRLPRVVAALKSARDHNVYRKLGISGLAPVVDGLALRLEKPVTTPSGIFQMSTGQYVVTTAKGRRYGVCIDTADAPEVQSLELCEWSDVLFKTNFWPAVDYPNHVRPLANADPLVLGRLGDLRSSRSRAREFDVCAIMRIWDGEGVEHNIRLLKAIADTKCAKFVLAVLLPGASDHLLRYLRQAGIPAATRGLKARDLWNKTARSTLNLIRLGVHYCVPWRVTGSLAAGSCIVLDRAPFSAWPQPLLEGVNYLSLGLDVSREAPVAPQGRYEDARGLIEDWLSRPQLINRVARSNGEYFDRFLEPQHVGAEIARAVEELDREMSPATSRSSPKRS